MIRLGAVSFVCLFLSAWPAQSQGIITTFAGNGNATFSGDGGPATAASLNHPRGLAIDRTRGIYIADADNWRIRLVSPAGIVSTVAGNGSYGAAGDGGQAINASLSDVNDIALDTAGNLYIADASNHRIRKVTTGGIISTFAGTGVQGSFGDGGPAINANLNRPVSVTIDAAGNLLICDSSNHNIRRVSLASGIITTYAGNGVPAFSGDGGQATAASLMYPLGVATDKSGNVYIADAGNNCIRKVSPGGVISTVAGISGHPGFGGDGAAAMGALLDIPAYVTVDSSGNLFIADAGNNRVRKVDGVSGIITTIAGGGNDGFSGDGGPAANSLLSFPWGMMTDASGTVYIADRVNSRIRTISGVASPLAITHNGNLTEGQSGVTYTVSVRNTGTAGSSGSLIVAGILPSGLTATAISGSGWACSLSSVACSRSDPLPAGGSYTPIALTVNIAANAPSQVTVQATLYGGGFPPATAGDLTMILAPFTDVSPSDSFLPAIDLMREYGIDPGCGGSPPLYCENANTTRGDMAVLVTRSVMGSDDFTYTTAPYFSDVPPSHPLFQWVQKMRDLQITSGCGPTTYCPDDPVTRGQMAVFIIRARYGATAAFSSPPVPLFIDVPAGYIFFSWIQEMKQLGITSGCGPTTYCPDDPVTQGQMAVFLMRGAFNQLLPSTTPVIASAFPATALPGTTLTIALTGQNTHFAGGATQVSAGAGIAVTGVFVANPTTLTVQVSVAANAASGPRSITATTGGEDATLPNGFLVQ